MERIVHGGDVYGGNAGLLDFSVCLNPAGAPQPVLRAAQEGVLRQQKVVQELEKGGNVILSDEDWDDIVQNADIIFDNFTKRLQQTYPSLNKDDLRYCCMVKMQLSQSSMAQVMHLERDSVKKRLKRIRMEKMGADSGVTLEELLYNF